MRHAGGLPVSPDAPDLLRGLVWRSFGSSGVNLEGDDSVLLVKLLVVRAVLAYGSDDEA